MPTPRPSTWDDLQLLGSARLGVNAPTLAPQLRLDPLPERFRLVYGAKREVLTRSGCRFTETPNQGEPKWP